MSTHGGMKMVARWLGRTGEIGQMPMMMVMMVMVMVVGRDDRQLPGSRGRRH